MTIKNNVENLLKREDETGILCRNNDNFLIMAYIREYHQDLRVELTGWISNQDLAKWSKELPALSEIKRIRADFQNSKGMYLAATGKQEQRRETEEKKREEYKK